MGAAMSKYMGAQGEDADIYGEQSADEPYLILANEKARSIINEMTADGEDFSWEEADDPPYLGLAVDRTSGIIMLCTVFERGLVAKHWCEACEAWHPVTKESAKHFWESFEANPPPGAEFISTH